MILALPTVIPITQLNMNCELLASDHLSVAHSFLLQTRHRSRAPSSSSPGSGTTQAAGTTTTARGTSSQRRKPPTIWPGWGPSCSSQKAHTPASPRARQPGAARTDTDMRAVLVRRFSHLVPPPGVSVVAGQEHICNYTSKPEPLATARLNLSSHPEAV